MHYHLTHYLSLYSLHHVQDSSFANRESDLSIDYPEREKTPSRGQAWISSLGKLFFYRLHPPFQFSIKTCPQQHHQSPSLLYDDQGLNYTVLLLNQS